MHNMLCLVRITKLSSSCFSYCAYMFLCYKPKCLVHALVYKFDRPEILPEKASVFFCFVFFTERRELIYGTKLSVTCCPSLLISSMVILCAKSQWFEADAHSMWGCIIIKGFWWGYFWLDFCNVLVTLDLLSQSGLQEQIGNFVKSFVLFLDKLFN